MKQDDAHDNGDTENKPKYDFDTDVANEPDIVINLPARKSGSLSMEEWSKLKKQDTSTLTPAQKKSVERADANLKDALKRISPKLTELTNMGNVASEALSKKFQVSSILENKLPTLPQSELPSQNMTRSVQNGDNNRSSMSVSCLGYQKLMSSIMLRLRIC